MTNFCCRSTLAFSTRNYSLSLSANLELERHSSGLNSWAENVNVQARITPRFTIANSRLNIADVEASARFRLLSADFSGTLRLNQPFQSLPTYARVATDLLGTVTSPGDFGRTLSRHALGTFGFGLDFRSNIRLLGLPITHIWGQIGQHTDVNAVGIVPVPAGTLFDVAAPMLGGSTSRSGANFNWNIMGGVLPLLSPEAISRGESATRMFPTYLYGRAQFNLPNATIGPLRLPNTTFGLEGSLRFADIISPSQSQPTYGQFIEQVQGRAAPERPAIGANAFIRADF